MEANIKLIKEKKGLHYTLGLVTGLAFSAIIVIVASVVMKKNMTATYEGISDVVNEITSSGDSTDEFIDGDTEDKLELLKSAIDEYYYLGDVTDEELKDGIYKGLMEALDDPYSVYYTKEEFDDLMQDTTGIYYGIGAYVSIDKDTLLTKVSGTIEGSPAEEAGLRPNDLIYKVDDTEVYGMELEDVVSLIRGAEGTEVTLTVIRDGENDYLEYTITRGKVNSVTVAYTMLDDGMAYIQIQEFDEVTVDQFKECLQQAKDDDMKGLIIDLRGNPGGVLDSVVSMLQEILPEGLVVYTEDKNGNREEYTCDGSKELQVPLVVLVDMNSASASEIFAGAVKDYGIGTLVGTTTYGKGIVQQIFPLSDGSAIKLTISAYYTPKGINIHGTGIEPDVECEFDADLYYDAENPVDNQLEKAKEILQEKIDGTFENN